MSALTVVRDTGVPYTTCPHCGERLELSTVDAQWRVRAPADVGDRLVLQLGSLAREELHVLVLNIKCIVITQERLYIGNVSSSLVRVGELFREAVHLHASGVILVHNHPSGDPTPSPDDLHLTAEAIAAGRLLDIAVLDHLIVAGDRFVSLRERGIGFDQPGQLRRAGGSNDLAD